MITLHRLGHQVEAFQLNPDLIMTVEANPDTVITLTNGAKIVVAEPPERVVDDVQRYRVDILAGALQRRHQHRAQSVPLRKTTPLRVTPAPVPAVANGSDGHPAA